MYPTVNYLCLLLILISTCCATQRTLKTFLNPGCGDLCTAENATTIYLRAEGNGDTLHYLWDFYGNPSLLLAITSPFTQLNIDWKNYLSNKPQSIYFTEEPRYTFGIVMQKIFEFNDINDKGLLDKINDANINVLNTRMFNWIRKSLFNDSKFVELEMNGNEYHDTVTDQTRLGDVQIMVNGFSTIEHSDVMPHMLHPEHSTQIDIILNKLETNSSFDSSRFGMELLLVSESKAHTGMFVDTKKIIDDEHTPGIFEVVELRTPWVKLTDGQQISAYLQWRPVSYTAPSRNVSESTEAIYYPLIDISNPSSITKYSLLYAYYGEKMDNLLVEKINISLGMKGDGFYKKTNYSTWTFIVGYGVSPRSDKFSFLVILIIMSIGYCLPVLMLAAISIYLCYPRVRKHHDNTSINS